MLQAFFHEWISSNINATPFACITVLLLQKKRSHCFSCVSFVDISFHAIAFDAFSICIEPFLSKYFALKLFPHLFAFSFDKEMENYFFFPYSVGTTITNGMTITSTIRLDLIIFPVGWMSFKLRELQCEKCTWRAIATRVQYGFEAYVSTDFKYSPYLPTKSALETLVMAYS